LVRLFIFRWVGLAPQHVEDPVVLIPDGVADGVAIQGIGHKAEVGAETFAILCQIPHNP
jgi:hypothetical protein